MFDFSIFITLLVSVLIFYFTIFFNLKKEIDDLTNSTSQKSKENALKIHNRKRKLFLLNIITVVLFLLIIFLYSLPTLFDALNSIEPIDFSYIANFFSKFLPFKKGFFSNANFKFSYITGIVLSIIVVCIIGIWLQFFVIEPDCFSEYAFEIILLIILSIGLIWINNYISAFLSYCIIHCFEFLSIILNIVAYVLIGIIVYTTISDIL